MNLERVTAKIKPRRGWESLDLGFKMVQHHWRSLYGIWFTVTLPIFVLGVAVLQEHLFWLIVVFWWLKPIFDSALLNYVSRALFGEYPTIKQTLKDFHTYAFKQVVSNLSWRRLSPTRSMDLAVSQLEGLKGSRRANRIRTLHSFNTGTASWLTVLFLILHVFFYFNIIILLLWFIPDIYLQDIGDHFGDFLWASNSNAGQTIQVFLMYLIIGFFSPFYITCGFTTYINQRTILEAWDIELVFRKLANRMQDYKKKTERKKLLGSLCAPLLIASIFATNSNIAKAETEEKLTHQSAKQEVEEILNKEPFKREVTEEETFYNFETEKSSSEDQYNHNSASIFTGVAKLVELLLWVFVFGLIGWFVYKVIENRSMFQRINPSDNSKSSPDALFGISMSPESLPDNPAEVALQLWNKKQYRKSLSILLRATLKEIISQYNCEFEDGYTELECAKIVKAETPVNLSQYFANLIQIWRRFAYGQQIPEHNDVEELCHQWSLIFSPNSQSNAEGTAQ
ncbi:hypothetical protein [Pleionea sediminis]|uniref:hypothetical protein n=1 Tax=Pleionea sediminis TaxID=2569479 RepID=UPI001184FE94|nr:hypothetical protein [Pleionea sediminis]